MENNMIILEESKKYLNDPRVKWIYENLYGEFEDFTVNIDDNNKIIIHGNICIPGEYDSIPYKIDEVYGNVVIDNIKEPVYYGNLNSLENFPSKIHGNFICKMNPNLISLKGGPEEVDGDFICVGCGLKDINEMPKVINGNFYVYKNSIEDLSPVLNSKIKGLIDVEFNPCVNTEIYTKLQKLNKIAFG